MSALRTVAFPKSILVLDAAVNLPLESTVNVATCVEDPYDPAVTPVLARVSARSTSAVPSKDTGPALPSPEILKSLAVSSAVAVSELPVIEPTNSVA